MKKKYITPDLEIVDFETQNAIMDEGGDLGGSTIDPFNGIGARVDWWNFPNGTELNEDGTPK